MEQTHQMNQQFLNLLKTHDGKQSLRIIKETINKMIINNIYKKELSPPVHEYKLD